jgi:hypothetical protein
MIGGGGLPRHDLLQSLFHGMVNGSGHSRMIGGSGLPRYYRTLVIHRLWTPGVIGIQRLSAQSCHGLTEDFHRIMEFSTG